MRFLKYTATLFLLVGGVLAGTCLLAVWILIPNNFRTKIENYFEKEKGKLTDRGRL